jgi:negative regulator of sigma E activity
MPRKHDFLDYVKQERSQFVTDFNHIRHSLPITLILSTENLIIAYDQMIDLLDSRVFNPPQEETPKEPDNA